MTRKLPMLWGFGAPKRPTVDAVRAKLGGRASTERGAGELVSLDLGGGLTQAGVVLFTRGQDVDVWTGEGVVRRARRDLVRPMEGPTPEAFAQVAADAVMFAGLSEGQRVRYRADEGTSVGTLVEKCKFGALVERDDHTVVGVSFRRIWPSEAN